MQQKKKQDWFFENAEETLEKLQIETEPELSRIGARLLYSVSIPLGMIDFYVRKIDGKDLLYSSLRITNIVDFDIALEHFNEWRRAPTAKAEEKSQQQQDREMIKDALQDFSGDMGL